MAVSLKPSMGRLPDGQHYARQLASAWDLAFNWLVPHERHAAMLLSIALSLTALALLWGWSKEAALFLQGWTGVLRGGEVFGAARADLVLPQDGAPGVQHVPLNIRPAKRHQAVRIDPADMVALVSAVFESLASSDRLWPFPLGSSLRLARAPQCLIL